MRVDLAIARALGRSLVDAYAYLGPEIDLWRAEYAISPWGPERDDLNAYKLACYARPIAREAPRWHQFDRTRALTEAEQSESDMEAQAAAAAQSWPTRK